MDFNIKNNLLKTSVSENRLGNKNIKTEIDDSLVSGMLRNDLDLNLDKESKNHFKKPEFKNNKNKNTSTKTVTSNCEGQKINAQKIERDPLILLKLL